MTAGVYCVWRRCHPSLARFSLARVSLTRASLARCILTRSQFGVFQFDVRPVWRVSLWRVSQFCVYVDPVDPVDPPVDPIQYSMQFFFCEGQFYLCACFLSGHVFCEEVLSTPVFRQATLLSAYFSFLYASYCLLHIFINQRVIATA